VAILIVPPLKHERRPAPGVRRADISRADLGPTLLEVCGARARLETRPAWSGRSRARSLLVDDDHPHPVFSEKTDRSERSHAVQTKAARMGDWKLVQRFAQELDPARPGRSRMVLREEEFFDLSRDRDEARNLILAAPAAAPLEALRSALAGFIEADREFAELPRSLQEKREELYREDPETLRRLRALGY
jgi:hypothetical protein